MTHSLTRRTALGLMAGGLAVPTLRHASAAGPSPVLVELFTSQGCSSCPPADKNMATLSQRQDVIAVTYNVDYWDYLGWHDTLAKPEYSKRQFDYGKSRGDMQVYTPQAVMNGHEHVTGSDVASMDKLIAQCREEGLLIAPTLTMDNKEVRVSLPAHDIGGEATLWLLAIAPSIGQVIAKGENAGQTVTYYNVVRNLVPAALWKGEAYDGRWMREAVMPKDCTQCVAVLQRDKTGPVLGVARA
ncbi:MAG: DUF1223 domain-containing protein [Hyphomicrobiales bacterium]